MTEWIPVGENFIEGDVIRWTEASYQPRRPGSWKKVKFGDRLITAEVRRTPPDEPWVYLLILDCEVVAEKMARTVYVVPKGSEAKRKRATIARCKAERLLWSDESARIIVLSRFLGGYGAES